MAESVEEKEESKKGILKKVFGLVFGRKKIVVVILIIVLGYFGWKYFSDRNDRDLETAKVERGKVAEELILTVWGLY